jgi:hypothetical protein
MRPPSRTLRGPRGVREGVFELTFHEDDVDSLGDDGVRALAAMAGRMPMLKSLEGMWCPEVSTAAFMELVEQGAKSWPMLKSFTFHGSKVHEEP